ncbi:MAG TPA: alpha/beta fold hydrolase, partial [Actinomycetota bacterium]|nr:alpha/beta fold hydrolase [Actinomycetota bacterium]
MAPSCHSRSGVDERGSGVEQVRFDTEDGVSLEGELRLPDGPARAGAVICHADPRQGGSKDHPLLWAIRNDLASRGFAVLSFNFRGVMGSEGSYGGGVSEAADVRAAIGVAREHAPGRTFVVGWSFGAGVALRVAVEDDRVAGLALLGIPLGESSLQLPALPARDVLRGSDLPVLLLVGEADPFAPVPDVKALGRRLARATVEVVSGTDHFFWKREREAARLVGRFAE